MGQNGRQRRAAKQRRRAQRERNHQPYDSFSAFTSTLVLSVLLRELVVTGTNAAQARDRFAEFPQREQQDAVQAEFETAVEALVGGGWTPLDLAEFVRRTSSDTATQYLLDVVATQAAAHPRQRVHPQWLAQLDQLGARPAPRLTTWAAHAGVAWRPLTDELIALLAQLITLPVVHPLLPPPGAESAAGEAASGIDPKILRRVRALLAKAESTEYEQEADALSAKAQSLMTQYSIDHVAASAGEHVALPGARRLWLDSPYVVPKALLVAEIASANRSRCAISERLGFVTLLGHGTDLDVIEVLTTSLLLQATRAMRLAGTHTTRNGTSRTRSFRQSFLVAYAGRIGERLRESAGLVTAEADAARGGSLLPVLAARDRVVDDAFGAAFPHLVERDVRVSNAAGWGAGRAAADLALFDIRDALGRTVRTSA